MPIYPIFLSPSMRVACLTLSILMIARVRPSLRDGFPSRSTVMTTLVLGSPRSLFTASVSDMFIVDSSSICTIRSPAFTPALYAGVPSMGAMTVSMPSRTDITIPIPPNLPRVPIMNSS
jgi:hypothetical protein